MKTTNPFSGFNGLDCRKHFEIGKSCISDPKSESSKLDSVTSARPGSQTAISDYFGFEVQDSSNFKILSGWLLENPRHFLFGPVLSLP
jgi:hypothetical protein